MIRNFNYTGRVKIDSSHVKIDTSDNGSGIMMFDCELNLETYDFPEQAKVIIEPYRAQMRMRFEFGTIGEFVVPERRELSDIPKTDIPLFTIKIVDPDSGKLLGYNDRIHTNQNKESEIKDYLFPIDYSDLGNRLYEVHFSDGLPTLRLNNKVHEFNEREFSSPLMVSIIYPSALNTVLNRIAYVNDLEDDEEWVNKWLQYINEVLGISTFENHAEDEIKDRWVTQVLDQFCRRFDVIKNFETM